MYTDPDILARWIFGVLAAIAFALLVTIWISDLVTERRRKRRRLAERARQLSC